MLALPTTGFRPSVKKHNARLDTVCDWIEGAAVFSGDNELSASDVVDTLCENGVYSSQDFAWERIDDAWGELRRRLAQLQHKPFTLEPRRLREVRSWRNDPAHAFCLILSYAKWYPAWARGFGEDYTEQGELFEQLTQEALVQLFPGWQVMPTGWSRTTPTHLSDVVKRVASALCELEGETELWSDRPMHEAGLDLVCYRPWKDSRAGVPAFLIQCASGDDWRDKLHTPNMDLWTKLIQFASVPKKAFSMPYALLANEFRQSCVLGNNILLDRPRLLSAANTSTEWPSTTLREKLVSWLEPRIRGLEWL